MHIRPYRQGDENALHTVFHSAIHLIASQNYSPQQVEAWAPTIADEALSRQYAQKIQTIRPFVVEIDSIIAAYGDLQITGYIDHFFVSGYFARRRVGSSLMEYLLSEASGKGIDVLTSDVSLTAQPFFERFGFRVIERRVVTVRGTQLPNAFMRRSSVA